MNIMILVTSKKSHRTLTEDLYTTGEEFKVFASLKRSNKTLHSVYYCKFYQIVAESGNQN